MKTRLTLVFLLTLLCCVIALGQNTEATAHIPAKGSPERQAILDALRGDQQIQFKVNFMASIP